MITIETVRENKNNMEIDTEDEIMNVISSELIQVKSEKKMKLKLISTKINRSVPDMIREYNTYGNLSINEVGAYIINRAECRYKTKRSYQNVVCAAKTKMNFQITSADLTPAYTPAASLATADAPNHNINAVRLQSATKSKTVNVNFQVKKMNRSIDKNEKGVGNEIFQFKKISRNTDKNEHGLEKENFTTTIAAQGDTGGNCSANDTIDVIHNYKKFAVPQKVGVFSGDETSTTLQALGEGVIKILSDQKSIMKWSVLYTPLSSGTLLSSDNYHFTHKSKYYAFYHLGTSESTGKIGFLDYNQREVELIQMKRIHNGEWLTTNQVLVSSPIKNKHIIRAVS
jgi:hypothetical protein